MIKLLDIENSVPIFLIKMSLKKLHNKKPITKEGKKC
jgi:hypothetical protein